MNTITVKSNGRELKLQIRDEADASVAAEIFSEHEYRIVDQIIRDASDPILDIGAHAGFFSLYARTLNSSVRIVAVEPEPKNLEFLDMHIKENDVKNIEVVRAALSAKSGNRQLEISRDSHNHRLMVAGDSDSGKKFVSVYTYSLSDLLKKCIINNVSLLKMDIEGGEYEVIDAVDDTDLSKIGAIIMEYHQKSGDFREIETRLRENKFAVQVFPSRFDKKMGFIFAKNKRK